MNNQNSLRCQIFARLISLFSSEILFLDLKMTKSKKPHVSENLTSPDISKITDNFSI